MGEAAPADDGDDRLLGGAVIRTEWLLNETRGHSSGGSSPARSPGLVPQAYHIHTSARTRVLLPQPAGEGGAKRRMGCGPLHQAQCLRAPIGGARRAWRRSCLAQRRANALDDERQSADDEFVGKSKNAKSRASKPGVSLGVPNLGFRCLMRAAVRFDDDFSRKTNEIRAVGPDRRLPAKAVSVDLVIPHRAPKHGLGFCHVLTLRPSKLARGLTETWRLVHLVYLSQA